MPISKRLAAPATVASPAAWDRPDIPIPTAATGDDTLDFATAAMLGLSDRPRWLPCRFLYDERGSRLFELICETPEYYLTRTEAAILRTCAPEIRDLTGPVTLVELGSGNAIKTRYLLDAYSRGARPTHYVPVDVSDTALRQARRAIAAEHPAVRVTPIHGQYEEAFPRLRGLSPAMLLFLGSTIGNLNQVQALAFWRDVTRHLSPGDHLLLGVDLVKDAWVLNAAYNDAAGHSAAFTRNLFARMNRELGAGLDLDAITHEAAYHEVRRRVEIYARFEAEQTIHIRPLGRTVRLQAGERVMTEISRKFVLDDLQEYLACFGLKTRRVFTDRRGWYAVLLLQRLPGSRAEARRSGGMAHDQH